MATPDAGVTQHIYAGRDAYVAGRDQTVNIDNRRVELAAEAVPHPAAVALAGPVTGLPRRPVRVFVGRDAALRVLETALAARGGAVVTQAVYGLGGVGKSELALQYADAHRGDYGLVWWITATDPEQVDAGLARLAGRLCPVLEMAGTTGEAAGWATGWLQAHDQWLLILDNVEDPADIEPLLGQLRGGHVIVTSRRDADWGRLADPVRLDVLAPAAAAQVLTLRTGHHDAADETAAVQIAAELGFLPLAIDQAAAYIVLQRVAPAAYLDSLRQSPARMYAVGGAQQTIALLWDLHITAIRDHNQAAARLLRVLAHYAPDAIPRAMLGGDAPHEDTDEALGLLASYSMITLTTETVSIHRLLQAVVLTRPGDVGDDARSLRETALDWLGAAIAQYHPTDMAGWPLLRALVPHADALARHFPAGEQPTRLGWVQDEMAMFLSSQGDSTQELRLWQSALSIYEATLGPDHPDTADVLGRLGVAYCDLGRAADALPLQQRALAIYEATLAPGHPHTTAMLGDLVATYRDLGELADVLPLQEALAFSQEALHPDHPITAVCLGNLAATYRDLGRPADALPLQQRALAITESLGPDHPGTAGRLAGLAATYRDLGQPADALPLQQRALAITEEARGPEDPSTADRLGNLAATYRDLGRPADALPLQQRALAITEATRGLDHPGTLIRLASLAATYWAMGRPADALPLQQRALAITTESLGPDHPDTVTCLRFLAAIYRAMGQPADALPLQQRALAITESTLGPDHLDTAIRLDNLAAIYRDLGQPADALPLQERALAITETALGPDHPDTATLLANLAATYWNLGQPADALPLQERALAITETALGPDHPDTATLLANLAATYWNLGQPADALPHQERALAITETALGPDHPDTATLLANLAATYWNLGQPADALPLQERALAITETALGPDHPDTATLLANLATAYRDLGRHGDALRLEEKAAQIRQRPQQTDDYG